MKRKEITSNIKDLQNSDYSIKEQTVLKIPISMRIKFYIKFASEEQIIQIIKEWKSKNELENVNKLLKRLQKKKPKMYNKIISEI